MNITFNPMISNNTSMKNQQKLYFQGGGTKKAKKSFKLFRNPMYRTAVMYTGIVATLFTGMHLLNRDIKAEFAARLVGWEDPEKYIEIKNIDCNKFKKGTLFIQAAENLRNTPVSERPDVYKNKKLLELRNKIEEEIRYDHNAWKER